MTIVHAAARLHQGRDCTKAQLTTHLIRKEGEAEGKQSLALWDILNLCRNEIGHKNHTSNVAPHLSVTCATDVILPCSPVPLALGVAPSGRGIIVA